MSPLKGNTFSMVLFAFNHPFLSFVFCLSLFTFCPPSCTVCTEWPEGVRAWQNWGGLHSEEGVNKQRKILTEMNTEGTERYKRWCSNVKRNETGCILVDSIGNTKLGANGNALSQRWTDVEFEKEMPNCHWEQSYRPRAITRHTLSMRIGKG